MSAPARRRGRRRWIRFATPLGMVLVLFAVTYVAYATQQPDTGDSGYLSPASTSADGGSRLAGLLGAEGVSIQRVRRSSDALVAADAGDATLFVPAPQYMHRYYVRMFKLLPSSTRVVLVAPSAKVLAAGRLPVLLVDRRLAVRAAEPACDFEPLRGAGPATVLRSRYSKAFGDGTDPQHSCYGGAVVAFHRAATEITVVGANEPFRNDRIDERDNATMVVALLSRAPKVIWLDLHSAERPPGFIDDPALAGAPDAPPSLGPGSPDPDFPIPGGSMPGEEGQPRLPPPAERPEGGAGGGSNPLWQAFPQWTFAVALLLLVATVLLALARGRRIGAPVTEPLPVTVRATETVEGRGRLYRRAKARAPALRTLRSAEIDRLTRLLDLPAGTSGGPATGGPAVGADERLVEAVAEQSGWPAEIVRETLYGADPDDDRALVDAAAALDRLHHAVLRRAATSPAATRPAVPVDPGPALREGDPP